MLFYLDSETKVSNQTKKMLVKAEPDINWLKCNIVHWPCGDIYVGINKKG